MEHWAQTISIGPMEQFFYLNWFTHNSCVTKLEKVEIEHTLFMHFENLTDSVSQSGGLGATRGPQQTSERDLKT